MGERRRRRYYEDDGLPDYEPGEGDRFSDLPGKAPLGRDAGLRERDAYDRRQAERVRNASDAGDSGGTTLFDDFDRYSGFGDREDRPKYKRPVKHRGLWMTLFFISLAVLTALVLLVLPQTAGVRYRFIPNIAFANGNIIRLENGRLQDMKAQKETAFSDRIYQGIYIDGIHVGGMTKAEAAGAVGAISDQPGDTFDISVTVGNQLWHITNETVPVYRNIDETVESAYAIGRGNTENIRGTEVTPFRERLGRISELKTAPVQLTTAMTYDHDALRRAVDEIVNYVNREPVNSMVDTFDFNTHAFTFTDDTPGVHIDGDELYGRLTAALDQADYHAAITVEPEVILAAVTKSELTNRFGKISSYTTNTTSNKNRNTNIRLSAEAINGKTVLPGDTFSFNETTGERTEAKGYKPATAISGGQTQDEIGGGVCQTSSTLFNAVARANLEIVSRSPHAWPSNYVEKGMDATVNWPGLDFKFRNNTDWPVFIVAHYENQKVTVEIYGMTLGTGVSIDLESTVTRVLEQPQGINYVINTDLAPGESKTTVTGRKGYMVDTYQVWYQNGQEVKRDLLCSSTYKAYQETVEYNPN